MHKDFDCGPMFQIHPYNPPIYKEEEKEMMNSAISERYLGVQFWNFRRGGPGMNPQSIIVPGPYGCMSIRLRRSQVKES
jgi:hypothetical protein